MFVKLISMPIFICLLGAVFFWAPFLLSFLLFNDASHLILWVNAAVVGASLGCFVVLKRKSLSRFVGTWMFLGIHLSGPIVLNWVLLDRTYNLDDKIDIGTLILLNLPPVFWWVTSMGGVLGILFVAPFLCYQLAREMVRMLERSGES